MRVVVMMQRQAQLPKLVLADGPTGGGSRRLDGREQQGDENADDRDRDNQLDQRESASTDESEGHELGPFMKSD